MIEAFTRLTEIIGQQATFRLMQLHGGTRIYIPEARHCGERHYLAVAIGHDQLLALAREFGGDRVEVPVGLYAVKKARNAEILERHRDGATQSELALHFGITERQVRNILAGRDVLEDPNQLRMSFE